MAEKVGGLLIELSANVARLQQDMNQATQHVKRASEQMSTAASFARGALEAIGAGLSIRAFVGFIKSTADASDGLLKMSQKTGITVENLSALQYAGKLSNVSMDSLGTSLKALAKNIDQGDENFARLGISLASIKGKSPDQVFGMIADKLSVMKDGFGKTAITLALLGKAGEDLIPMMNGGSKGLKEMADEAGRLGAIISTETAQAAEAFNDNLTRLETRLQSVGKAIANPVISNLNTFITQVMAAEKVTGSWLKAIALSFTPASERIVDITAQLAKLREERAKMEGQGTARSTLGWLIGENTVGTLDTVIANLEKERATLQDVLKLTQAIDNAPDPAKGRTGNAPTPKDPKAAEEARRRLAEAKQLAGEITAFNKEVDDAQKTAMDARMKQLDDMDQAQKDAARDQMDLDRDVAAFNKEVDDAQAVSMRAAEKQAEDLAKSTKDAAKEMIQAIEGFGRSTSKVFAQAIMDGKLSTDSLTSMFKNFFAEMIEQQLYKGVFQPLFGAAGGALGSLFGGAGAGGGSMIGLATGTNFVPQDMPAMLHKGEAVIPKDFNPNGMGGGGVTIVQNISVGNGVSTQELYGAMKMAKASAKSEIMRDLQRNGSFAKATR